MPVVNVKGLGLMRVAQQSQPQATAGINARADKQRATQDAIGNFFGALPPAEDMRDMLENPEQLKQALDDKFQEVRNFTDMATQGLTPTQKAAFLTMGVNGLGDLAGLAADMEMYITDPESRTWFNAAMTGTGVAGGALSVSPAVAGILPIVQKNIDTWRDTTLYHGTAADVRRFDPSMGGSVTKARSAKQGTWLVDDPEVAGGYARLAAEDAPVQKLVDESQAAERAGDWDRAHDLMAEAEKLEQGGELIGGGGQNIMPLKVRGNLMEFDAEGATMSDLDDAQLFKWSQEAKKGGYDGLKVKNFSDNADYGQYTAADHYLIFDPDNIRSTFDAPPLQRESAVGEMMGGGVKPRLPDAAEGTKRLYNAGTLDRDPSGWLVPHVSDWVREVAEGTGYTQDGGDLADITADLVYMSDDPGGWVDSIVSRKLGKGNADITIDDIRNHGRLSVIDAPIDDDEIFRVGDWDESQGKLTDLSGGQREFYDTPFYSEGDVYSGEGRMVDMPVGPEPSDFISNQVQEITHTLTGDDLIDFLNEHQAEKMAKLRNK